MDTIWTRTPDVEVVFRFSGTRHTPVRDGYRPAHRIREDYLTTGVHHYFDVTEVAPDGQARGTITFITPEAYAASLWVGKVLDIQEGGRIVGTATVERVLNPVLEK
jgi:elongation factor Tu